MKITISGREFDVELAGEHPGHIATIPLANGMEHKRFVIANGKTKAETINNAIVWLTNFVHLEESND